MNVFELFAKISLNTGDYEKSLGDASEKTTSFADKLKNGLSTAAKAGAAALTAAAAGVTALTKASLDQYAEYEQLVGGVETLFKSSADTVQQYAANAYQTAGVSANTYMQQATAFSASLIQSLGGDTQAAAEYANQAIMDMSDNANKMGTDIESIQATYQSLMRGNYAMLDNLKLGYGGTKAELERLVADAEKLTGQALDPAKFSDVITAIHAVQESMGITGTTAREAATTIEGSVNMTKAAWSNLLTGIADDNANLDVLIDNFVSSVEVAASNIVPRVTQILSGLGTAIEQLAPIIAQELPAMISAVLPSMISAGAQLLIGLVTGLVSALPQLAAQIPQIVMTIYNSIVAVGPQLLSAGAQLLSMLVNGIITGLPILAQGVSQIVIGFYGFLQTHLPEFLAAGAEVVTNIANGILSAIPLLISQLPQVITALIEYFVSTMPQILEIGIQLLTNLINGIIQTIPDLVARIPEIITAFISTVVSHFPEIVANGVELLGQLVDGILSVLSTVRDAAGEIISNVIGGISDLFGDIYNIGAEIVNKAKDGFMSMVNSARQWGSDLIQNFIDGVLGMWDSLKSTVSNVASTVKSFLGFSEPEEGPLSNFHTYAPDMMELFAQGITENEDLIKNAFNKAIDFDKGIDFESSSLNFTNSALGMSSAGVINGVSSAVQSGNSIGNIQINLVMPDNTKLASYLLPSLVNVSKANGTPILNPT